MCLYVEEEGGWDVVGLFFLIVRREKENGGGSRWGSIGRIEMDFWLWLALD